MIDIIDDIELFRLLRRKLPIGYNNPDIYQDINNPLSKYIYRNLCKDGVSKSIKIIDEDLLDDEVILAKVNLVDDRLAINILYNRQNIDNNIISNFIDFDFINLKKYNLILNRSDEHRYVYTEEEGYKKFTNINCNYNYRLSINYKGIKVNMEIRPRYITSQFRYFSKKDRSNFHNLGHLDVNVILSLVQYRINTLENNGGQ